MRRALLVSTFSFCLAAGASAQSSQPASKTQPNRHVAPATASPAALQAARASFAQLPLSFEENRGQTDGRVKYLSRAANYNLFLTADEAVLTLGNPATRHGCTGLSGRPGGNCPDAGTGGADPSTNQPESAVLWLKMLGANPAAQISGSDQLPGKINYYVGNDPSKWRTGVRQFGRVNYQGVYPGVDLTYYGNRRQLESDYLVAPGADPRAIEFEIKGATGSRIDAQGNLVLATSAGNVQLLRPVVYQVVKGIRREVSGRYDLRDKNHVGFAIEKYDTRDPLVIDPILIYSTYLGGSTLSGTDSGNAVAIDASGDVYVTGQAGSSDFPGAALNGPVAQSTPAAFVTKFDPTGNVILYSTLLRGTTGFSDVGNGIGVDSAGNAYVGGVTTDTDFPLLNPFQATPGNGVTSFESTGFVAGLAGDGTLLYSTYFGGRNENDVNVIQGLFADSAGNAYVVGNTTSNNFPTVNPLQATLNSSFAFESNAIVAKFNPQGQPIYSTYLGGNGNDVGNAIVADAAGNAYITGQTTSTDFPVQSSPAPFQASLNGGSANVFVSKLSFTTSSSTLSLAASTYLGGTGTDEGWGIAIDNATPPNVYVTGETTSTGAGTNSFPTKNPMSGTYAGVPYSGATNAGATDAFVTKLQGDFTVLNYSTYVGGSGTDIGYGISLDGANPPNVFIAGSTTSSDFPLSNPLQSALGGVTSTNAFVSELKSDGSVLTYSTYLGGVQTDQGRGIATDSSGNAYITGTTTSPNFPVLSSSGVATNPFDGQLGSSSGNAFVAKISPSAAPSALNFFPPVYNFHNVGVGSGVTGTGGFGTETVTLSNNTASSVTIISFSFTGANAGDFTVQPAGTTCTNGLALPTGASCLVNIRFAPTLQDLRTAQLTINSTPTSTTVLNLTGFGAVPEVNLSTNSLNFGTSVPLNVGSTNIVQITNTGGAPLNVGSVQFTGANASAFTLALNACASVGPNQSCFIEVTFTPTAAQAYSGNLLINDNAVGSPQTVTLSGTGVAKVVVSPPSIEYGGWIVNTSSPDNNFTLTNGSGGSITLTSIVRGGTNPGDFPVDANASTCLNGLVLPAGTSCYLDVFFKPTAASAIDGRTATFQFNWNGTLTGSQTVNVMGAGETGVTLYVNSFTAPNEYVGVTGSVTGGDILYNGTVNPITVNSIVLSGANPQDWTVQLGSSPTGSDCSADGIVPANSYCFLSGSFTPSAVGVRTATATFNYTGAPPNTPLTLSLTGTGIPGPVVFPFFLAFGSQIQNVLSPTHRVLLQNVMKTDLTISSVSAPTGANAGDFAELASSTCKAGTVKGGGNCYIDLTFTPGALGARTATITVTDNGPGSPRTLTLTGTGVPGSDTISVTPAVVDFGNVPLVGAGLTQSTVTASFYLTNGGATPTTITTSTGAPNPAIATNAPPFALVTGTGSTCAPVPTSTPIVTTVLPQGGMCSVAVTFKPTAVGEFTNTVTLTDSVGGLHTVTIQGAGVDQAALSMNNVTFTQLPGTTTTPASTATLTNTGSGPATLTSIRLSENSTSNFAIVSSGTTCTIGAVIPPAGTCVVALTFTAPSALGNYNGSLTISANLGNGITGSGFSGLNGNVVSGGFTVSPTPPLDFGTVAIGTTVDYGQVFTRFTNITITNNNPGTVTFTSVAPQTAGDFTVTSNTCTGALQAGNSCTFDVVFAPTVNGAETNNVVLSYSGAPNSPFLVAVKGTGSNAVAATPNPVNVSGSVGTNAGPTVTIGNGSSSTVTITGTSAITGNSAFSFSFNTCTILTATGTPGNTCEYFLNFNPTSPGSNLTAQFTVNYMIGATPGSIVVNLNGTATAPAISISPNPVTFPGQNVNTQSQIINVVVQNTGTDILSFPGLPTITGPNANDFALAVGNFSTNCQFAFMQPGVSCVIPINFTPSQLTPGSARSATLTIKDNAFPSGTQTVALAGTANAGSVTVETNNLSFPQTNIGVSVTQGILFSNTTNAAVVFNGVTYSTPAPPSGSYSNDTGPNACVSGKAVGAFTGTCVIYIKFSPTGLTNPSTATVHFGASGTIAITLSGAGSNPTVFASPTTLTFTAQLLSTSSSPQLVTLTNGTSAAVSISATPTVTGDFQLGTNSCTNGANVSQNGGTCTVNIIFTPTATGARTGTLTITDGPGDANSPHTVTLNGTGIAPDVTIGKVHTGNFTTGQTGTYTITVTNSGGSATTGTTTVTDTLPTGMAFNSNTNSGVWSCIAPSQIVTCTSSAAIAPNGGTSAFNLVVNVAAGAAGTPINSVGVTTAGDTGTTGKTATDPTTVTFPAPTITTISPTSAAAGGAPFTLTVNGTNFVSGSVVNFNGAAKTTTFVSATQITAAIPAPDIATAGTFNVTVTNPAPGGGTSGISTFTVNNPVPTITTLSPSGGVVNGAAFTLTVNGTNFNHSSVVNYNGAARTTTFVSATQVTIQIATGDLAAFGTFPVSVTNPAPGGGTSASVNFSVTNPPPTITTLSPTSAVAGGAGFTLTVNGTNFVSGAVVNFNGAAKTTTFVSATQVTASITAPDIATAGTFNVTVTNPAPGGGTSGSSPFTVNNPLPTITTLSPTSTTAGGVAFTLTVNGTNFNSSSVVNFNGTAKTTTFVSATQVTAAITAGDIATAGAFNVTVTNPVPGGGTSGTSPFTVNNPGPTITTISPTSAIKGGAAFTLTVNGANFVSTSVVNFNGSARTTTFVSATQVTAAITVADIATAGTFNVTVTNPAPGGGTSGNATLTVNNPAPAITTLSPSSAIVGGAGFTLTVNGTNFVSGAVVNFNGAAKTTTFVSATQVTASIAAADIAATGTFNVKVTNPAPGGGTSASSPFAVNNPVPTITTLSPSSATRGAAAFTLTVNGTNFISTSVVNFNGAARTTTFVSATQVTATITTGDIATAGTFNVTVTNPAPGGGTSGNASFTVNNPVPTITSLSPNGATAGGAGFTLTVNGTNFVPTSVVNFNASARTTTFVSATQLTATVPSTDIATVGSGNVTVTNPAPGGGTTTNVVFTISSVPNPVPTLTTISPTSGVVGQAVNLTLTGTNFVAGSIVNFGVIADTGGVATNGGATLTITIPAGQVTAAGTVNVSVTNPAPGGGTSTAQTFTINNPVPAITTLSPASTLAGGAAFTLTVNGSNFVSGSVVNFNGAARATTFVSATQVTAGITGPDIAAAGTFNVTVSNPAPGGGTSGISPFAVNNPAPVIATLSPSGASAGGAAFTLTVNGTNFVSGATLSFNGAAKTTTVVNATQVTAPITAVDIAAAGTFNVIVTNPSPGGGASGSSPFTVNNPLPTITTLSPTSGLAGGVAFTLTVNGTNFNSSSVVNFNGNAKATTFVSATQVTASITAADIATAGTFNVTVTNPAPGGGTSGSSQFTVNNPVPTITTLSPASGLAGGAAFTLTVNGTNFNASSVVKFNGTAKTTTLVSATQVTASIAAADIATAGSFNVTVTNPAPGGGTSGNSTFTVNNPVPTISTLSPTSATKGGAAFPLTVNGTNFVSNSVVNFNGAARATTFVSATQLTTAITAPDIAAAGTFNVTVTNPAPGGGTSVNSSFTVNNPVPTITTLSPASKTVGGAAFTLTVNGTGFLSGATLSFNGVSRATAFVSATQLTAAITAGDIATAGTFNVTVTNPAPTTGPSVAQTFAVNNPLPTITTVSPASGTAGGAAFTLTVNGTNFVATSVVNFNGNAKATTFVSATQVTASITPADIATAGTFNVTVTNPAPGGGTSGNASFTANNPVPTVTTLSPTGAIKGGTSFTLTVNGTNLNSSSVVNFNGAAKATTFVSATQVTAAITAADIAATGTFNVTVTNPAPGGGTSGNASFNVTDFTVTPGTSGTLSVTAGTPATLTLNVTTTPAIALPADMTFTCAVPAGLSGAGCSLNPATMAKGSPSGSSTVLTITTTASLPPSSRRRDPQTPFAPWIPVTVLAGIAMLWFTKQNRTATLRARPVFLTLGLLLIASAGLVGCTAAQMSTPKGASSVTVTATSGGVSKTTNVAINVQ